MSQPQVSVALPMFGDHRAVEALPAVCRAWLRQEVPCEVVIATGPGIELPDLGDGVRIVPAGSGPISIGPLRNLAASAARAPVLYLGDADVAPLGSDFLGRALALLRDRVVIQPWMYRLVNPSEAADRLTPPTGQVPACYVAAGADGRLTPVPGEEFIWLGTEMMVVEPPPGYGWQYEDGTTWRPPPYHWGGLLVDRRTFDAVGGYCTRYSGWGCEDDDLIIKLESRATVLRAWRDARELTCLHFEHPRDHASQSIPANQTNQLILVERLTAGVEAMIDEDR